MNMNLLQAFLETANNQAAPVIMEEFTLAGVTGSFLGTFGDPQIMPVMTKTGYQDHLVTPLKVQASRLAALTTTQLQAIAHSSIVRTSTGRTFYVQVADYTAVVVYTFMLTDRQL